MSRAVCVSLTCLSAGVALSGCATAPVQTAESYASDGARATYGVASTGAHAVYTTGGDVYSGVGAVAKRPLRDFNMMQDPIPAVLLRTESKPYDLAGINSCQVILDRVAELDLALGPDLDAPKDKSGSRMSRGADGAASAALDAATDAAEHFLPMRSVIKRVSGATRYENHVKHAVLAGTVRRAFLKAIGMAHNCGWPASPLVFNPTDVAVASSAWTKPGDQAGLQMLAIATPAPLAVPPVTQAPVSEQSPKVTLASANVAAIVRPASNARGATTHTVAVQTIEVQTTKVPVPRQTIASSTATTPILMQRVVTVSASESVTPEPSNASPAGYYTAPPTYAAPAATAASFASSGPSAPWSTPQH
jgi:hypothetical protein